MHTEEEDQYSATGTSCPIDGMTHTVEYQSYDPFRWMITVRITEIPSHFSSAGEDNNCGGLEEIGLTKTPGMRWRLREGTEVV